MMTSALLRNFVGAAMLAVVGLSQAAPGAPDAVWLDDLAKWRTRADEGLKRERGWLSIVSRDELPPGTSRIGSAPGSDVLLPKGLAPANLGTIVVDKDTLRLNLAHGLSMRTVIGREAGDEFTSRELASGPERVEWVTSGRLSLQFVKREDGKFVVRAADRDSPRAREFTGRLWYAPKPEFRVPARFVPKPDGATFPIANVRGEISYEKVAGTLEFTLNGQRLTLDALDDEGNLFIIFRDATSGESTYPPGRFLFIERPKDGVWIVDLNRAYNPPCAFSAYTTCPLPPPQNWLKAAVPAGERYASRKG